MTHSKLLGNISTQGRNCFLLVLNDFLLGCMWQGKQFDNKTLDKKCEWQESDRGLTQKVNLNRHDGKGWKALNRLDSPYFWWNKTAWADSKMDLSHWIVHCALNCQQAVKPPKVLERPLRIPNRQRASLTYSQNIDLKSPDLHLAWSDRVWK